MQMVINLSNDSPHFCNSQTRSCFCRRLRFLLKLGIHRTALSLFSPQSFGCEPAATCGWRTPDSLQQQTHAQLTTVLFFACWLSCILAPLDIFLTMAVPSEGAPKDPSDTSERQDVNNASNSEDNGGRQMSLSSDEVNYLIFR